VYVQWGAIHSIMGQAAGPMVHTRGLAANPFGATYFHGYKGVLFEVLRNSCVATMILFSVTCECVVVW